MAHEQSQRQKLPQIEHEAHEAYDLSEQIGFILRQVNQRHVAIFTEVMGSDLTPTQWAVLSRLYVEGSSSQNELGRQTAMDVATVKGVVDRLIGRKLVIAGKDPEDGRRLILRLSDKGHAFTQERLESAAIVTKLTLQPLTSKQRSTLVTLLKRML